MMTVEELKKEGAIYFEKVTDGMQQYENQIIRMNAFQAVDKFMEMWEMLGCKNMYVDFYYFTLPEQARQQIDTVLTYQELEYIHQMEHEEGQVLFPVRNFTFYLCKAECNGDAVLHHLYDRGLPEHLVGQLRRRIRGIHGKRSVRI